MIHSVNGNLLEDPAEAYVNTVNTVGVMGKGIALQFKQAFPEVYKQYEKDCKKGGVEIGRMHVVETTGLLHPKYVINFPTKKHWRNPTKLSYITEGLEDLVRVIQELDIRSIAVPPLGCGNGGMDWNVVRPYILEAFQDMEVDVHLYEPAGSPPLDQMPVRTVPPRMTKGRALLLAAMSQYAGIGYRLTQLEIQKIAYFLHETGALPKLQFTKQQFGPYAEQLHHVLQRMEGHFIRGYGDRTTHSEIVLLEGAKEKALEFLANDPEALGQLKEVKRLISGFENPYGMELLASVYWVLQNRRETVNSALSIIHEIQSWNERKKRIFSSADIEKVWKYLSDEVLHVS